MHWDAYERVIKKITLPLHEDHVFYDRGLLWGNEAGVQAGIETHELDLQEAAVVRELATRIPLGWRIWRRRRRPTRRAASS